MQQFLISSYSNSTLINEFLLNQLELACMSYVIDKLEKYTVVLKFRPIALKEQNKYLFNPSFKDFIKI